MVDPRRLQSFADRILSLKADEDQIKKDIRGIYEEAVEAEIDKTGLGQLVTYLRKREKNANDFDAKEAIFLGYLELYNASLSRAHAYARARTGEIIKDEHEQPETAQQSTTASVSEPLSGKPMQGKDASRTIPQVSHADNREAVTDPHRESGETNSGAIGGRQLQPALRTGVASGVVDTHPAEPAGAPAGEAVATAVASPVSNIHHLRSASGLERMPGCQHPSACAGMWNKRCFSCEKAWAATHSDEAATG